jgi:hypothetical protein
MRRLACFALAVTLGANTAVAQDARTQAQALFFEGRDLIARGALREGCARLEASHDLEPSLGTLLNLADCHERLGLVARPWAELRSAAAQARARRDDERERWATERAARLEPRVPYITLRIALRDNPTDAGQRTSPSVRLDGKRLPLSTFAVPLAVEPGQHRLEVEAPRYRSQQLSFQLAEAERRELALALEPTTAPHAPPPATTVKARVPERQRRAPTRSHRTGQLAYAGWTTIALGTLAAATGAGLSLGAASAWSEARSGCRAGLTDCDAAAVAQGRHAGALADGATVTLVLSGALLGAGAALLWLDHRQWSLRATPATLQLGAVF